MDREGIFERIFGHCAHQAGRIEQGVESSSNYLHYALDNERLRLVDSVAGAFQSKIADVAQCAALVRRYASQPPEGSLRHAPEEYDLLDDAMQAAIASIVFQSMVRWRAFLKIVETLGDACPPIQGGPDYLSAAEAFEMLLGFDCMMSDTDPQTKIAAVDAFVADALATLMDVMEPVYEPTEDEVRKQAYAAQFGPDLSSLTEASWLYEKAIAEGRRYVTLDLRGGMQPLQRWLMDEKVKSWVSTIAVTNHPDRITLLSRAIIGRAGEILGWVPPECEERRVSDHPASDAVIRRGTRVISMVHVLHRAGFQRIRLLPFASGSGCHWRAWITASDNVQADGFNLIDEDLEDTGGHVAKYSSAEENHYFGWPDTKGHGARRLASIFLERFPQIAERGRGCDWAYAGWLTDLLGCAENGTLISLMQEGIPSPDTLHRWQPPPPVRAQR